MRDTGCGKAAVSPREALSKPCALFLKEVEADMATGSSLSLFRASGLPGESCGFLRRAQAMPLASLLWQISGEASPSGTEQLEAWTQALFLYEIVPLSAYNLFDWLPIFTFLSVQPESASNLNLQK